MSDNTFHVPSGDVAGPIGHKNHVAGNTRRFIVDFSHWLDNGVTLLAAPAPAVTNLTATVTDITISSVTLLASHNRVSFMVAGGSVNENFTLSMQVQDTRSQIKNVTMAFTVVAP